MAQVREVIAAGLAQRKEKQLKVRQPLAAVSLKRGRFNKELETLIRDELNVKKVVYKKSIEGELEFDLNLTPELLMEGYAREAMRQIQDMRKEAKYQMDEQATIHWHSFDEGVVRAMENWSEEIKRDTVLNAFEKHRKDGLVYDVEKETELAPNKKIWLAVKK